MDVVQTPLGEWLAELARAETSAEILLICRLLCKARTIETRHDRLLELIAEKTREFGLADNLDVARAQKLVRDEKDRVTGTLRRMRARQLSGGIAATDGFHN